MPLLEVVGKGPARSVGRPLKVGIVGDVDVRNIRVDEFRQDLVVESGYVRDSGQGGVAAWDCVNDMMTDDIDGDIDDFGSAAPDTDNDLNDEADDSATDDSTFADEVDGVDEASLDTAAEADDPFADDGLFDADAATDSATEFEEFEEFFDTEPVATGEDPSDLDF